MLDDRIPVILVCGGRTYDNKDLVWSVLDRICQEYGRIWLPRIKIVNGGAKGADSIATDYAVVNWTLLKEYPADWTKHGKAAGVIRNQQMLDEEHIDLVVAFPGGRGTADMVRRARLNNIKVIEVEDNEKSYA